MKTRGELREWFLSEVLPLEPALVHFLRRNWRIEADIADLRQEIYVRIFNSARDTIPSNVPAFLFTTARNLLINHARRARIVSFELVGEVEELATVDEINPERHALARDELRRIRAVIAKLPPRCQEIVLLRKVEGMSHKEITERTGLAARTIEAHLARAMRDISGYLLMASAEPFADASAPALEGQHR